MARIEAAVHSDQHFPWRVLDQAALIDALKTERIAGAGLDYYDGEPGVPQELCKMDDVMAFAPHQQRYHRTRAAMSDLAVDGVLSAFAGVLPRKCCKRQKSG